LFGRGMHAPVPKVYNLAGVPVKVLFAPDHTPELEIMKQMLKGTTELYFAIFTFAGSSGIDDAMLALARGGMTIKGALDPTQAKQDWAAPAWLVHSNIEFYVPRRTGPLADLRKLHHKLMVIDERIVIAGSFNYTAPANEYNDENIFVLGSVHTDVDGVHVAADQCRDLAIQMKTEIQSDHRTQRPVLPRVIPPGRLGAKQARGRRLRAEVSWVRGNLQRRPGSAPRDAQFGPPRVLKTNSPGATPGCSGMMTA
jgi:phosphatidylserine/phosphatidylglycerophosphate/cardiolipin synthase-like enzyme